jgi:hypothetical protein
MKMTLPPMASQASDEFGSRFPGKCSRNQRKSSVLPRAASSATVACRVVRGARDASGTLGHSWSNAHHATRTQPLEYRAM